jgi:hypothetical protein
MPDLPIPAQVWRRFLAFLRDNRSGTISLHVKRGRVLSATISEQVPTTPLPRQESVVESSQHNRPA